MRYVVIKYPMALPEESKLFSIVEFTKNADTSAFIDFVREINAGADVQLNPVDSDNINIVVDGWFNYLFVPTRDLSKSGPVSSWYCSKQ